jgi:hypothetical protein
MKMGPNMVSQANPRVIEAVWEEVRNRMIPATASETEVRAFRILFFTGVRAYDDLIIRMAKLHHDDRTEVWRGIQEELAAFGNKQS